MSAASRRALRLLVGPTDCRPLATRFQLSTGATPRSQLPSATGIDFDGCKGPQPPKSTRLPFEADIVLSPKPSHLVPESFH